MLGVALLMGTATLMLYLFEEADPRTATVTPHEAEPKGDGYRLIDRTCGSSLDWRSEMRCATLVTPAIQTAAGMQRFRLPVVILPSQSPQRRPDPVVYLPGGPGGSAGLDADSLTFWKNWQDYANLHRDLILMERRGVGDSEPALVCKAYDQFSEQVIGEAVAPEEEARRAGRILQRCFQNLEKTGAFHPDQLGTDQSARDLEALLVRLPYEQVNLVGVSYGTRLALATARRPEARSRIRSLALDSLYPPDQGGLVSWPGVVTESLERFMAYCAERRSCVGSETSLDALLDEALQALAGEPLRLTVEPWNRNGPVTVVLDDNRLLAAVFSALYDRTLWGEVPRALRGAVERDEAALVPLVTDFIGRALDDSFSSLTFMAVDCLDHPLGSRAAFDAQLAQYPRFRQYLDTWDQSVCHWLGSADEPLLPLEKPDIPTLILAGALDPVTPAHWAYQVADQWPAAQLYSAEEIGHSVLWSEPCVEAGLGKFLDAPRQPWRPDCKSAKE